MSTTIPNVVTVDSLVRLNGVSRSKVLRLVASGEIQPLVHLNEGERLVPLFDPAVAVVISQILDRSRTESRPPTIC